MNSKQSIEYLIRKIYSKYAPSKSSEVSSLFEKYNGQENELLEKICKKYGVSDHEIRLFEVELNDGQIEVRKGKFKKAAWILIGLLIVLAVIFIFKSSSKTVSNAEVGIAVEDQNLFNELPIGRTETIPVMNESIVEKSNEEKFEESEKHYVVLSKTFFHDSATASSKRKAYLVEGEVFSSKIEENGFLFVEFVNPKGQLTKGWIQNDGSIAQREVKIVQSNTIKSKLIQYGVEYHYVDADVMDKGESNEGSDDMFYTFENDGILWMKFERIENDGSKRELSPKSCKFTIKGNKISMMKADWIISKGSAGVLKVTKTDEPFHYYLVPRSR